MSRDITKPLSHSEINSDIPRRPRGRSYPGLGIRLHRRALIDQPAFEASPDLGSVEPKGTFANARAYGSEIPLRC
jgi:hypothetical protein